VNKVKFSSSGKKLIPDLQELSNNPVGGGEAMTLNASNSFVSSVPFFEARRNLTYTWTCDAIFA
jgi:hypothetical protein